MAIIVYRNISLQRSLLCEINVMNVFNTDLIFTPEVFILCKKYEDKGNQGRQILCRSLYVYQVLYNFLAKTLARQVEIKYRSVQRLFKAMKTCVIFNVSLAKTERNTW